MPRLRDEDVADLDVKELDAAEYSEGNFTSYGGEVPPNDTILTAYVSKIWWTRTNNDDPMLKVLVEASENEGELEEYNGLPAWENMALTTGAKFKWAPFFEHFGITMKDIKGKKVVVSDKEDNMGAPIEKIGAFVPGSDESWCRIIVAREKYNGQWQAHVAGWLPFDEEEPEDADGDEDVDEDVDEVDEVDDEEDVDSEEDADEEPEDEPEPPARGRRTAAKPAPARQAAKPAAKASKPASATPTRAARGRAATAAVAPAKGKPASAAPKRGRRSAAAGSTDDPPF